MKKFAILAFAAVLVVMFTIPACALENQFGGFWRTRFFTQQNFSGNDQDEAQDVSRADTRTRLYWTAVFNENLKFVNKFEMNAVWGGQDGSIPDSYGDIGADGLSVRVKNSYADFNTGPVNWKVGVQGAVLSRGFLFDDDFAGAVVAFQGENFSVPFIWMKANEGGMGKNANDFDVDYYAVAPSFTVADSVTVNPYFLYAYSKDASGWDPTSSVLGGTTEKLKLWYAGLDVDANFNMFNLWMTGIYQGGDVDRVAMDSVDFQAWLAAAGFAAPMAWGDIHGEFFYATGDDDSDNDWENFWVPAGQSYYWAEIMGLGIFDNQASNNAPGDKISDIMAANFGVVVKPMDKLSVALDGWYAKRINDIAGLNEDYLGTEIDLTLTYQLVQGLNLDVVGAYLFAGDATTEKATDDANPYEVGARLSLSF